jgi:large subunit ribosomal protein L22
MQIVAKLNDYRQSPRKVRLVANLVKGKQVDRASELLSVTPKRSTDPLAKLLKSAVSNAKKNFSLGTENLFVKEFRVDVGAILYRRLPRAFGSASPLRKRTSHVTVVLETREPKAKKASKKLEAAK